MHVRYADGTRFVINARATEVWTEWLPPYRATDMALYLLGPIIGFILAVRGVTVLHATAITIDDRAFALVGASGSGKSTTAAAFSMRGNPVLSEDIVALLDGGSSILAQPGYPSVRLWPDSVEMLFPTVDALPPLTPGWEKRNLTLGSPDRPFASRPKELAAIYYLAGRSDDSSAPRIDRMTPADGLVTLLANTYVNLRPRFRMRAAEFPILSRLAATVPVRRVTSHADPRRLSDLHDLIDGDFRSVIAAAPHSGA